MHRLENFYQYKPGHHVPKRFAAFAWQSQVVHVPRERLDSKSTHALYCKLSIGGGRGTHLLQLLVLLGLNVVLVGLAAVLAVLQQQLLLQLFDAFRHRLILQSSKRLHT